MTEKRNPGLRSPVIRKMLARDLPGLPPKVATEDDTYTLAILAAVWLDNDDRLAEERRLAEPANVV